MREILFRGKRTDNGEWVYGNLVRGCDEKYAYIVEFGNKELCRNYINVKPDTIGQYTGLIDIYGVKVFEGDIVKRFWFSKRAGMKFTTFDYDSEEFEVIGNIYDNPELIKENEQA